MSYQYDIFISYRSDCPTTHWMHSVFIPELTKVLKPQRPNGLKFWRDKEQIKTGSSWPDALRSGLASSCLLLPILTPYYFGSEWCRRELAIMLERQSKLGLCSAASLQGLVFPIQTFDGHKYPEILTGRMQFKDFRDLTEIRRGTRKWDIFKDKLNELAKDIDAILDTPPSHCPEWKDFTGEEIEPLLRIVEPRTHNLPRLFPISDKAAPCLPIQSEGGAQ